MNLLCRDGCCCAKVLLLIAIVLSLVAGWVMDKLICWNCVADVDEFYERIGRIDVDQVKEYLRTKQYRNLLNSSSTDPRLKPCTQLPGASQEWPDDLELVLPLPPNLNKLEELTSYFVPTMSMFWPKSRARLLIATDSLGSKENVEAYTKGIERLTKDYLTSVRVANAVTLDQLGPVKDPSRKLYGNTQQWLKFWADNFTTAAHVGYIDADTTWMTRITRGDLFDEQNRPIVRAVYGPPQDRFYWSKVVSDVPRIVGVKSPMKCMTYFPVILKTAHLPLIREHIRKHLGFATFDDAYVEIFKKYDSAEFDLWCAYLWNYHRDSYHWVINEALPGWRGHYDGLVEDPEAAGMLPYMKRNRPHIAIHPPYEISNGMSKGLIAIMATGICYSLTTAEIEAGRKPAFCSKINRFTERNIFEWQFEKHDFSHVPWVMEAHVARIQRNERCTHEWQEIGFLQYDAIENTAHVENTYETAWKGVHALLFIIFLLYATAFFCWYRQSEAEFIGRWFSYFRSFRLAGYLPLPRVPKSA